MGLTNFLGNCCFVWFYVFNCFGFFWVKDGWFMDFVILGDSIALPWCIGI